MPKCRNCGANVEADASICPVCGIENPVKTKKVRTVDITQTLDPNLPDYQQYKRKSKLVCSLLFGLIGFTGAPYFYLKDLSKGFQYLLGHIVFLAAGLGVVYLLNKDLLVTVLIVLVVLIYLFNIIMAFRCYFKGDIKDGNGEFLE